MELSACQLLTEKLWRCLESNEVKTHDHMPSELSGLKVLEESFYYCPRTAKPKDESLKTKLL
ncbi:uncharacterized protein N7483_011262 [Penicillium malachiteum]|uniref:uncharacterized protein n=1 Tax=Penicillium malachiteum TaxID=1324776 RepID=UPI002547B0AB|nr:uncharacterized protein N7483_011262 [Penicillium malachiteum]KAJ5714081.1 hypothetical protein N7483_011262 [Penicillium malachiteum]